MMDCNNVCISGLDSFIQYWFTGKRGNLNARVLDFKWYEIVDDVPFELRNLVFPT